MQFKYNKNTYLNYIQWWVIIAIILGQYVEFLLLCMVLLISFQVFKPFNKIQQIIFYLLLLLIYSLITILFNSYNYYKFIQQYFLISILIICYYFFFLLNKNKIQEIFNKYIYIMHVVCILGLFQFAIYLFFRINIFSFLYGNDNFDYSTKIIRVHSIFIESGYLGSCLVPVISYLFFNKEYYWKNKLKSYLFIIVYLLTLSSIAYFILFLILIVKSFYLSKIFRFLSITIFFILFYLASLNSKYNYDEVQDSNYIGMIYKKIIQTTSFFDSNNSIEDYEKLNASSYSFLTNLTASIEAPSRLFGTGLGTHQENYERTILNNDYYLFGLNSSDGYSLLIRLFSEFGIIGVILYFIFLYKNFNYGNVINISVFFLLIALLIRGGHYTLYGTLFFHFMYYHTNKFNDKRKYYA